LKSITSWQSLLRAAQPCDHVVQLYTDDAFLTRAVSDYVASGFAEGQGAILIATPPHVHAFDDALALRGVDVPAVRARGQLIVRDAETILGRFMIDGVPDRARFRHLAGEVLDAVRTAGYPRVRLFGEMVDLLWNHSLPATLQLEALWKEVVDDEGVALLCAYRVDNFDRAAHRGVLHQISRSHSHVIPVEDYERLETAVDRAYRDVFGSLGDARALREILVAHEAPASAMPPAQAALVALRHVSGEMADAVLDRARHHYAAPSR
jgi:DcmR-like sensory protein